MLFELLNRYNFTTYAPAVFGGSFKRAKVIGIVDYETAKKYANVDLVQRQVFALLPPGTPDRISKYMFVLIELPGGIKNVLAYPWIIATTIIKVEATNLVISVTDVDDTDMAKIRDVLNTMGYTFNIQTIDV